MFKFIVKFASLRQAKNFWMVVKCSSQIFFDRFSDATLTINLNKTEFCKAYVQYLGHIVERNQVKPTDVKVKAISDFPVPSCRKQLMRFFGMV